MKLHPILISIIMLSYNSLISQGTATDSTWIDQLEAIVVTAQYAPESAQNAIYKVRVINRKTIDAKAANNLRELLQQELNLDLAQNSVFGSSLEMQGVSRENIKILIDGVPVIGRLNGIVDLNQINLNNIERVEVIEGPVSVFYGTDAMGGIINLITKNSQQKKMEGSISAYYESINAINLNADIGYKMGRNLIQVNGGLYHFKGLSTLEGGRNLNWEERKQQFTDLMINRNIKELKLRYTGHFSKEQLFSMGELDSRGAIKDKNYHTRRLDNALNLQGNVFGNKYLDATLSYADYQRYHNTFNVDPVTYESELSTTEIKDDNVVKYNYTNLRLSFGKTEAAHRWNYVIGADLNNETAEGSRILNRQQAVQTLALFASLNYKPTDDVEIQPGGRYTWNSTYGSLFSPAVNAKVRFGDKNTLRFSYARGFRAPSIKELFLDFNLSAGPFTYIISGNEQLKVEKSHSFNIQYSLNAQIGKTHSLLIEPSLFYNDISNLISLSTLVDFKRYYININRFKSLGGKINFTYIPGKSILLKMGFGTVGRYNEFTEDFDTSEFLYSPEFSFTFNYAIERLGLNMDVYYKFSGERTGFYVDSQTEALHETTRSAFHTLNSSISKSLFNRKINLQVGVKNLLDVTDLETINLIGEAHSRDMQLWGRSFFVRMIVSF